MDIETIDTRIREEARKELKSALDKASIPLLDALHARHSSNKLIVKDVDKNEVHIYDRNVINQIIAAAFVRQAPKAEDKAVEEFLKKVEGLQGQIDELYSEVNYRG